MESVIGFIHGSRSLILYNFDIEVNEILDFHASVVAQSVDFIQLAFLISLRKRYFIKYCGRNHSFYMFLLEILIRLVDYHVLRCINFFHYAT